MVYGRDGRDGHESLKQAAMLLWQIPDAMLGCLDCSFGVLQQIAGQLPKRELNEMTSV